MRVTLKSVNDRLADLEHDVRLEKGDGYFYFSGGEATDWLDRTVKVPIRGSAIGTPARPFNGELWDVRTNDLAPNLAPPPQRPPRLHKLLNQPWRLQPQRITARVTRRLVEQSPARAVASLT
jgi:hypothetical protein